MSGKTIYDGSVKTQSLDSIKAFLTWKGRATDPTPSTIEFMQEGRMMLVLSNKKDSYYVVTSNKCSCLSATYHPGQPCKHQEAILPRADRDIQRDGGGSIKPDAKWPGGLNGPVDECRGGGIDGLLSLLVAIAREREKDLKELEDPAN